MRLLVLSDLHREFWKKRELPFTFSDSCADAVLLAGDIDTSGSRAVAWAEQSFPNVPVIYIRGNHESYGHNLESEIEKTRIASAASKNVKFLECDEFLIGNVRFLGATLWTDFELFGAENRPFAMAKASEVMTDYSRIRLASQGFRKLRPSDTALLHQSHKSWLKMKLAEPTKGPTVVATHMAPSSKSVSHQYANDVLSCAFASDLDDLVSQADLWIHGHMHESFDYKLGKCRVVCNPLGYLSRSGEPENPNFCSNFIVDVPSS